MNNMGVTIPKGEIMRAKVFTFWRTFPLTLLVLLAMGIRLPAQGYVQSQKVSQSANSNGSVLVARRFMFNFPNVRASGNRTAGASRGSCPKHFASPVALLPPEQGIGLTVDPNPTFFFNISQPSTASAEFIVQEIQEKKGETTAPKGETTTPKSNIIIIREVYATTVDLPKTSGVISISLPQGNDSSQSLEVGKRYQWSFSLICDDDGDRGQDIVLEGEIERVEPSAELTSALQKAAPKDRPSVYADAGLWYNTLASLAKLRQERPNDSELVTDWATLLQSVGLDGIAQSPLVGSVEGHND